MLSPATNPSADRLTALLKQVRKIPNAKALERIAVQGYVKAQVLCCLAACQVAAATTTFTSLPILAPTLLAVGGLVAAGGAYLVIRRTRSYQTLAETSPQYGRVLALAAQSPGASILLAEIKKLGRSVTYRDVHLMGAMCIVDYQAMSAARRARSTPIK